MGHIGGGEILAVGIAGLILLGIAVLVRKIAKKQSAD